MTENQDYLKLMAQKIVKHKDNFKDNPNRYTGLFMIITPILSPEQREEFNSQLREFATDNYSLRPESAEKLCYAYHHPLLASQKVMVNIRHKNTSFGFDSIERQQIDLVKLERGLRNLALWLLITFKKITKEVGLNFNENEFGISDISVGAGSFL